MKNHPHNPSALSLGSEELFQSGSHWLALMLALYCLYLGAWFIYGTETIYFALVGIAGITAIVVGLAATRASGLIRVFLILLCLAISFDTIVEGSYAHNDWQFAGLELWMIAKLGALFFWFSAWGLFAITLFEKNRGKLWVHMLTMLPLVGLVGAYVSFYLNDHVDLQSIEHRIEVVLAAFNLLGLLVCLACVSLGIGRPFVLMVCGFALFASSDFVFIDPDMEDPALTAYMDPVWALGRFLILGGALLLPKNESSSASDELASTARRSGLGSLLIVFSFGVVLAIGIINNNAEQKVVESFLFVIVCVGFVILIAQVSKRFDKAVNFMSDWITKLMENRMESINWRSEGTLLINVLEITNLDWVLNAVSESAKRVRKNVIFLGPERLYKHYIPRHETDTIRCFLVMPFGQPWSNDVHATLRRACERNNVHALRGDDIFTPTDILEDIWQGINNSHFIIADITGRNPNVLYELGIAHTLGKPVLILTQTAEDVPIDLGTRRMLIYGNAKGDELARLLDKALVEIIKEYGWDTQIEAVPQISHPA